MDRKTFKHIYSFKIYNFKDLEEVIEKLKKDGYTWFNDRDIFDITGYQMRYSSYDDIESFLLSDEHIENNYEEIYGYDGEKHFIQINVFDDKELTCGTDDVGDNDNYITVLYSSDIYDNIDIYLQGSKMGLL